MTGRLHIGGKHVAENVNENVVIEGYLTKLSSDGKNVELKTFDETKINVALNSPYSDEVSGIMQVFGTVTSKSTIAADTYCRFAPEEDEEAFDPEDHNDFMNVLKIINCQDVGGKCSLIADRANDSIMHTDDN
ncbi:uncharacterized protein LOC123274222 [Cotesia glomerata]|uniref:Uncharacterized protein n=1 Tax=Cotesia glomerata TaxID=32391 RepID=A0AAV7I4C8_COTGL|nr:uncharacterized protein LOC123274222 [Cotesia glomerata]KAH0544234.1 hypothetical protein KQX54_001366 [Cotesia glomerata]